MCGIFGFIIKDCQDKSPDDIKKNINRLFRLAETRGKEAAGVALSGLNGIHVHKSSYSASKMIKSKAYSQFYHDAIAALNISNGGPLAILGHARLVTDGFQSIDMNNQPVIRDSTVTIHNGIVTNVDTLWQKFSDLTPASAVDSEIIPALLRFYIEAKGCSLLEALQHTFEQIKGEATIATLFSEYEDLVLATNTGSLYLVDGIKHGILGFLSENYQAQQFVNSIKQPDQEFTIRKIEAGRSVFINWRTLDIREYDLTKKHVEISPKLESNRNIESRFLTLMEKKKSLKRCSRCVLPETMPFIEFDKNGVCNYCTSYEKKELLGKEKLSQLLSSHKKNNGESDCFFTFSGGRDSCYGLHVLKTQYDMNPVAYTYDWGMVTPLARRNQAALCGKLGVEHLWVSADIGKKRLNIKRNLQAWLKNPHLGMIPLLMAGDKQFFFYANHYSRKMNIDLLVLSTNNLEKTDFKSGFAGVPPNDNSGRHYHLNAFKKMSIALFYGTQFLKNPRYLNPSVADTLFAYASYYFTNQDYLYLYDYVPWIEEEVESVLIDEYNWELAPDTRSTWRIGDGTAPFYNYVYDTIAGFTEFDTFRSNQIREGLITRERALELIAQENQPRWESIREYLQIINLDFDTTVRTIERMPKLYDL